MHRPQGSTATTRSYQLGLKGYGVGSGALVTGRLLTARHFTCLYFRTRGSIPYGKLDWKCYISNNLEEGSEDDVLWKIVLEESACAFRVPDFINASCEHTECEQKKTHRIHTIYKTYI